MLITGLLLSGTGCKDYLEEKSISNITSDSYYKSRDGFEDLIRSCYTLLRGISKQRNLVLQGTDIFTTNGWDAGEAGDALNSYDVTFNSSNGDLKALWNLLYIEIGRTNTAISRGPAVTDMDNSLLQVRMAEAKFLRAFCYFYLVQQWGDIPLRLTETVSPSKDATKTAAADVYKQIINDLTEAAATLPPAASDYGRATKGAAQFLLARVYLTRGWNFNNSLGGSPADFQAALKYADTVISAYPLAARYSDLFPQHVENPLLQGNPAQNDKNPEIVFAVQYSDNILTSGNDPMDAYSTAEPGNDAHSIFGGDVQGIPGNLGRTSDYNRQQDKFVATPAMYRLYSPLLDSRFQWNFVDAQYALKDVPNFHPISGDNNTTINIKKGDTVLLFRPWNDPASAQNKGMDVGGTKPYAVYNVPDYSLARSAKTPFTVPNVHPLMWKFWQPNIPYGDAYGTLDFILFRSAEAYLIAAEATLKGATGGRLGSADIYYNKILDRALGTNAGVIPMCAAIPGNVTSLDSASYRATAGNITIDLILDERARELMGENMRWYDLKRTGKLVERTKAMNPWTKLSGTIDAHHLLRPIPQSEIDLSSPTIPQNDGY
ncbi:hypothetical protein MMC2321_02440 [Chitinophaga sp. MM2321]